MGFRHMKAGRHALTWREQAVHEDAVMVPISYLLCERLAMTLRTRAGPPDKKYTRVYST